MWIEPKIDWTSNDYFNAEDYNRIIGNVNYLKVLAQKLYPEFSSNDLGSDKTYESLIYAEEINAIEDDIEIISNSTYGEKIGEKQIFYANGKTPTYEEFNRIEMATLAMHDKLEAQFNGRRMMKFMLGNREVF